MTCSLPNVAPALGTKRKENSTNFILNFETESPQLLSLFFPLGSSAAADDDDECKNGGGCLLIFY